MGQLQLVSANALQISPFKINAIVNYVRVYGLFSLKKCKLKIGKCSTIKVKSIRLKNQIN